MRGIPAQFLIYFFLFVFLVELISYFGIRILFLHFKKTTRRYIAFILIVVSILTTGLLLYSFSNPELLRQSRNYTLFYIVISVTFLNLLPKFFFTVMTILSYLARVILKRNSQILMMAGSFLLSCGLVVVIFYGIFAGRFDIQVQKQNLYFSDLPEQMNGFKIVQLSDIHLGSFGKNPEILKKTIQIIEQLQPDILLFTGDIVNNFGVEMVGFEPFLKQLSGKYGKFAIQGNHDYGDYFNWPDTISKRENLNLIKAGLIDAGFILMQNQWQKVAVKDTSFSLIGVENWGHAPFPQYANLEVAMNGIAKYSFKILMSHDPAHWRAKVVPDTDIQLTLSGHTHGGQFGMKFAGIEFSPIFFNQKNWGGLYQSDNQLLYVNRGLGTVGFPGRIEMRPEITLLTLFRSNNH